MERRGIRKLISGTAALFCFCAVLLMQQNVSQAAGTYLDFNEFPVTTGVVPSDSANWEYSSSVTKNYGYAESASSGWKSKTKLSDGLNWFFNFNRKDRCDTHMYVDTFGYLDITAKGHDGNALRNVVTGGLSKQSDGTCSAPRGTRLYNRESYTGPGQVYTAGKIGHSYIYFKKINTIGSSRDVSPYRMATDANRLSAYVYLPPGTSNGVGGTGSGVQQTYQVGIFRDPTSTGYHHYINFLTRGGGWTKIQIDETTNGDNGGNGATRYIPNFLQSIWQFYFTTLPYAGIAVPPYEVLIDDIEFARDTYVNQNNQTISNLAILYRDSDKTFEISLQDKYKNNVNAHSTYELRYSMNPITNENWSSATPANIIADSRFYIKARTDGKFQKWWPYYQGVWAPFSLSATDTANLQPGQTIHFAVKDISQTAANPAVPADGINGYWGVRKGGRPYDQLPGTFNLTTDRTAMGYVKRISYTLGSKERPAPPTDLKETL